MIGGDEMREEERRVEEWKAEDTSRGEERGRTKQERRVEDWTGEKMREEEIILCCYLLERN